MATTDIVGACGASAAAFLFGVLVDLVGVAVVVVVVGGGPLKLEGVTDASGEAPVSDGFALPGLDREAG